MRLIAAELNGFRRFTRNHEGFGKLEVDGPLTAVVGPNEAGKTSILHALSRLSDTAPVDLERDATRLAGVSANDVVIEALFLVEPEDRKLIADFRGADDQTRARWFGVVKRASGEIEYTLTPNLPRPPEARRTAIRAIRSAMRRSDWPAAQLESDGAGPERFEEAVNLLESQDEWLGSDRLELLRDLASSVSLVDPMNYDALVAALQAAHVAETEEHPNDQAKQKLAAMVPNFELFDDRRPELQTDYDLDELDDASIPLVDRLPEAFADFGRLAELDLSFLRNLLLADDSGTARGVLDDANARLRTAFAAWSQGKGRVAAQIERLGGTTIRIHVSNHAGGLTKLDERSAGLRVFVSLLAMTAKPEHQVPPIVLIDELERHLHYDAQADVVQVLTNQTALPQIIYTTHSAGCLPEDLGLGVRSVGPIDNTNHSRIRNRFWSSEKDSPSLGFSPLLVGMGASTLAFVPVRNAVMSEGATEIVLLPTLLREATGRKALGFQVAPAASQAPEATIAGLDKEAPRVVWLVDGDPAGAEIRKRLSRVVDRSRVVPLGGPRSRLVLEDLLQPSVYAAAINAQLQRMGSGERVPMSTLRGTNRPAKLRKWCSAKNLKELRKVDIANRVLDIRHDHSELLSSKGRRVLNALHDQLSELFDPADESDRSIAH